VTAVAEALRLSLAEGRIMVAKIVGRDISNLDESGVVRSTIESAAENLSDGFIAPLFWYLLLGLPGLLAYKVINTADSMIAYKSDKYEEFGWATAKLDDIINWVPARLSAMVILLLNLKFDKIYIVMRDAKLHRSPNAGWPETAMATLLNIALAGPRTYNGVDGSDPYINPEGDYILSSNHITDCTKFLWQIWLIIFSLVSFGSIMYWLM
jgi:adenosylcobinamide-phosphate synthase